MEGESRKGAVTPTGAVFLSYASEDTEAAERIATALRTAGIEVCFDKSALRGGETWDRSIREQINECALFIPVVSANAHARIEIRPRRLRLRPTPTIGRPVIKASGCRAIADDQRSARGL